MKQNIKDALTIIFALIAIFFLFEISRNGRYQMVIDKMARDQLLLDTRNGKTYETISNGNVKSGGPYYSWQILADEIK